MGCKEDKGKSMMSALFISIATSEGMSQAEVMLNSEEVDFIIVKLCLAGGISQSISQADC